MIRIGLFSILFLISSSQSFATDPRLSPPSFEKTQDIFIRHQNQISSTIKPLSLLGTADDLSDCRKNIEKIVCWVDHDSWGLPNRPCLAGGEKFISSFQGHFDRSPDLIKKMYCHMDRLWVEKSLVSTAYASPEVDDNNHLISGAVGIREEILESSLSFDDWLSWKEEASFGGSLVTTAPHLGIIQYSSDHATKEFFLDYVLDHEFGHLFDFANHLNQVSTCEYKEISPGHKGWVGDCKPLPGSWGTFSWARIDIPNSNADFSFRSSICFYFCKGSFIDSKDAITLFQGLMSSSFQSTYASYNPWEDWAESFALYLAHVNFGLHYGVTVQEQYFDLTGHLNSSNLQPKRDYVHKFLNGPILYPGDQ
jgi:hypothetical protein